MTKAYPGYRTSSVEWVDQLPSHWSEGRLRWLANRFAGGTPDKNRLDFWEDGDIPWLASGAVNQGTIVEPSAFITGTALQHSSARWIPVGAVVMALAGQGKTKGMVARLGIRSTCNQSMAAIVPTSEINGDYLYWWLTSNYQSIRNMAGGDDRDGLNLEIIASISTPLPPVPEQTAIAAFLDRETAKIDELVAEQRRLIDLLREKRQAVISHAVTKGLNPNARLKPSGIDWLGDVPEGWEVKRLSRVCGFEQGKAHEPYFDDDGAFICVTARFVSTAGEKFKRCSTNLTPAAVGDILMVMSDLPNGRALARAFLVDQPGVYAVNQRVCRISVNGGGDARYFAYQLNRHTTLLSEDDGFNQTHLSNASFTKLLLVVPPEDEQKRIADTLDAKTGAFDTLTTTAETAISLLQERRAALISAAVTGKIDVRTTVPVAEVQTDPQELRNAAAGAIIARLWRMPTFGRVKNQKVVYLAEAYAGVLEFQGNYRREAAGPLDRALLDSLETSLVRANVIRVDQPQGKGTAVSYRFTGNAAALQAILNSQLGPRLERFNRLLEGVSDLDTRSIEAVATLFAAWNDFLIEGHEPTDEEIVREVLEKWHPEKPDKFRSSDLHPWLGWMRRKQITPNGTGPKTSSGRLF